MERSDCRLYSGPLSVAAQKVLGALQAQRRHAARQNHSHSNYLLETREYGSQWEPLSQSSTSQEERRDQPLVSPLSHYNPQWQDSQTSAYNQLSQTQDSCWDASPQRQTPRTQAYYQHSQMYSHKKHSEPHSQQPKPGQAPSFTQWDISGFTQKDKYTLSRQTPQRLSEHQVTAWRDSEEITPHFDISKGMSSSSATVKDKRPEMEIVENIPLKDLTASHSQWKPCLFSPNEVSYYQQVTTKTGEKHVSLKPVRLNLSQQNNAEEKEVCFTNQHGGLDDILKITEEKQPTEPNVKVFHNNSDNTLQNNTEKSTENGSHPDVGDEEQSGMGEEQSLGHTSISDGIVLPVESELYKDISGQCELTGHAVTKTPEKHSTKGPETSKLVPGDTTEESRDLLQVMLEVTEVSVAEGMKTDGNEAGLDRVSLEDKKTDKIERSAVGRESVVTEDSRESCPTPVMSQECREAVSRFMNPSVGGDTHSHHDKLQAPSEATVDSAVKSSPLDFLSSPKESCQTEHSNRLNPHRKSYQPPLKPSFTLKRKSEAPQPQSATNVSSKDGSARRLLKWEPPGFSQEQTDKGRKMGERFLEHSDLSSYQSKNSLMDKIKTDMDIDSGDPRQTLQSNVKEKYKEPSRKVVKHAPTSADCTPPKQFKHGPDQVLETAQPGASHVEHRSQSKAGSLTSGLTSDPRVTDSSKLTRDQMDYFLKRAGQSEALVLTMVHRDGTTQLDPEQKLTPPVWGLLLLMKNQLDRSTPEETLGPNDSLVYFKLEHAPAWAQQPTQEHHELFTRDMLLQVFSRSELVVCYKAKDVLRVVLQLFKRDLTWKQVVGCQIQDPQVSGWLLDPADPASCFQDLLNKHCKQPRITPALGSKKVSQIIAGLYSLYKLNRELCFKLKSQGLWGLYSVMEMNMIPVLAAMESCHIHVDKEALKRTSDLLGTKMRQLEQEAHKAAGQVFLLTSSTQLRTVLFEKLCLHERCDNKKLPKTINKQQSTSEAALLQLQDLHPLPKIVLEYRQVHKIKSTFVDGILSCMMTKNYISSTWYQTSVVTGRISAKHPNFQALPRQPLQVSRKQYIPGKEKEVVTVHPRAMFVPKEGWTFLSADFCQVELRLLAHLSSDPELLRIFTDPEADVFSMLASQWMGVSETEVTAEDREHAKRIVYSVVYGAGPERLSGILGVSTEQARRFQDSFLQTYKEVQTFIQKTVTQCQKKGYVLSVMGRRRTLPNINSPDWAVRMQAERQAVNFVVQGSAADLCKMAMIRIFHLLSTSSSLSARLIAQLHDELLYEVEDSQVEQFAAVVRSTMESLKHIDQLAVHLKVPLKVVVSSGKSWGSMSELNVPPSQPPSLNLHL